MLLQIKVYLIATVYLFGALFMYLFPPRNFDMSGAKLRTRRSVDDKFKLKKYVDYNTLWLTLKEFAQRDPEVINLIQLTPLTSENRSIFAVELRSDRQSRKPGIFIIAALDAMAWGASNAILEFSQKLLYDASYQTPFFNDYDWYLIPMANPDGIAFTQGLNSPLDANPLLENATAKHPSRPLEWHKNVDNQVAKSSCFGTNINRNFAYHWQDDVSKTPKRCSQSYPGERPFSTAEAKAIRRYVDGLGENIGLAIHLHVSFVPKKEYILYPWRYSLRRPSNYQTLQEIGEYAARKARLPDGRLYEVHQSSSDDRIAGTLADYMSGVVGTDLVFVIKPHHPMFPNFTDTTVLDLYVQKSITSVLSVVRGWRSSTKLNTLHFFGKEIEF
ncbi:unnamed protein product [Arctia plantaginis]|uniref:Peptidase M14 domain-containing protein n=1 Tax=Arctia plantaginis TaxID=874455 RepID=A0A8S0ZBD8_ARCPL|nr:unnamed protein product [Arctia plantaginis]CAB3230051.1 unnamed protein product [Arctia plantaginis]